MDPLNRALRFYRNNFPVLFVVTAAYTAPVFLFMHSYWRYLYVKKSVVGQDILTLSLGILVLLSFMQAGVVYFFYQRMLKPKVSIVNSMFAGMMYIHKVLFANLLRVMIISVVLFMAGIVMRKLGLAPGLLKLVVFIAMLFILFVIIRTAFVELLILAEQKMVLVSMKESFDMTGKLWIRIMTFLAPIMMLALVLSSLAAVWLKNTIGIILFDLALFSVLISLMTVIFLSFYWQIRHPDEQA